MPHLDSEPDERAADRDANCRQRGLAAEVGDLGVVEAQLHACDDQFAIRFAQALECLLVPGEELSSDRLLEWRRIGCGCVEGRRRAGRTPRRATQRVAEPVAQSLTHVRAEGPFVLRRERLDSTDGSHQRILNDVFGVEMLTGPRRQTPMRPSSEPGKIPRAELVASDLVALTRAEQQGERRRDVHAGNSVRRQDVGVPVIAHGLRRAG